MDISLNRVGQMPVKTRLQTDANLSFGVAGNLYTHSSAEGNHAVIDDAVINLHTVSALAQNFGFVKRVEVLRHIGLRGFDFVQQLTYIFFFLAQAVDDFQAHGR